MLNSTANMKSVKRISVSHESIGLVNVKAPADANTKFDAFLFCLHFIPHAIPPLKQQISSPRQN